MTWIGGAARRALPVVALVAQACGGGDGARPDTARPAPRDSIAAGGAGAQPAATSGNGPVVLFLGTSLTAGLGLDPEQAYPQRVAELAAAAGTPIRVLNRGLSGETSAGAVQRVNWVLQAPADVVVIETGANDGLRGIDPDSTQANLVQIVERVRAARPAARLLLVQMEAPPNLGDEYTRAFRAMYPTVAKQYGLPLVPFLLDGVAGEAALNQPDGIHPNEQGARRVARTVWRALAPIVAEAGAAPPQGGVTP